MPRKNQNERFLWDEMNLKRAVAAVLVNKSSNRNSALTFGIPLETLRRHVLKAKRGEGVQKEIGRPPVLTEDQENELCDLLLKMESRLYGADSSGSEESGVQILLET